MQLGTKSAPFMAAFSSKGPNTIHTGDPQVYFQPDITAPGVSVIAAYTEAEGPTNQEFDKRLVEFTSLTGTSMSCPHVSGTAGLLKTLYPTWSPAAIKSAIMTTSITHDNREEPLLNASYFRITPFSYGAGHVQPNSAMDPGLVYDLTFNDYLDFFCSLGYNETQISLFIESPYKCTKKISLTNLNYPSIRVPKLSGSITVKRILKNVGSLATYRAQVQKPTGTSVFVEPKILKFSKVDEEKSFNVTLQVKQANTAKNYVFGSLIWSDGKHNVKSPIVVKAA
ncbi:Subtilisin-like protease [Quillaja saponaria]|uniref:Subtilisin-like protease n=1 Tax=Quillaja saponaria TaxID=32244 RepID=A0AAD7LLK3_QUISA|nr:Subtilisin-like protease [Quillaja saponaria]